MAGMRVAYLFVAAFLIPHISAFENVPEMCKWSGEACRRLSEHDMFQYNCDTKNHMQDNQEYSCWEECKYDGILCNDDYCKGYKLRCPLTSTPQPTILTTMLLGGSTSVRKTTIPQKRDADGQNTTTESSTQKTAETGAQENASKDTKEIVYVTKSDTYTQVMITVVVVGLLAFSIPFCYRQYQRTCSQDNGTKETRDDHGATMKYQTKDNGEGEMRIRMPDDGNTQQHNTGKSAEEVALLSESLEQQQSTNDGELDRLSYEQLSRLVRTLGLAMGNAENKRRQRHQSTTLSTVDDSTDNDQKTFHKVGQTSVRRADLDSLDKGRLTDDMVKALVTLYAQVVISLNIRVQVISFHERLGEDFSEQHVVLWLRNTSAPPEGNTHSAPSEENTHFYLAIVEVEAKVIHVCDSLSNLEMAAEKRLVETEPRLAGFKVTNSILQTDKQRDSVSCGLYTIMFVEKYLTAIRDGTYSLGQVDSYHLRFLTANKTADPADYREQLRNMSKQY